MSKLLINERPLVVLPSLAKALGTDEAIILQQIHFLCDFSKNERDGFKWVYNTLAQWHGEHFWYIHERTMRRAFANLEKAGVLVSSSSFNKMKMDRTKWYRVDYDALAKLTNSPCGQNDHMDRPNCPNVEDKMTESNRTDWPHCSGQNDLSNNHKTTQETTTKTTTIDNASADASVSAPVKAKRQNRKADAIALLVSNGVSEQIANDFMAVRTSKRAGTLTETAMNGIATQAAKAGLTVEQAVTICIDRNWVGFNADWIKPTHTRVNKTDSSWLLLKSRKEAVVAWDEAKREALVTRRNHESADWKEPQWMPVPDVNLLNQIRQHFVEAA